MTSCISWSCVARPDVGQMAAYAALENGAGDKEFYETKLATGRYYMARPLKMTGTHLARIQTGANAVMTLDAANF